MSGSDFSQLRELAADLGKAGAETKRKASLVIAKTAHDIEADAKRLAPWDTGTLSNSISSDVKELSAEIGPTVDYGVYLEYGTVHMSPQPYMGPAADRREPAFVQAMEQLVGEVLS